MATDIQHLRRWIGKTETVHDSVASVPVRGLNATLDYPGDIPQAGDALPPLWHWLYFLPQRRDSELGPDGNAIGGEFMPPVPLARRMWAGGRYKWVDRLRIGEDVSRKSVIEDVSCKSGRSGELVFLVVRHEISGPRGLVLTEWHDIVYKPLVDENAGAKVPGLPAPANAVWTRRMQADPVMLFRYSALTFNGYRIHYDWRYVTEIGGYPGLIVHGPLMATLLMELARSNNPGRNVAEFSFRATRPVFDIHPFELCGKPDAAGRSAQMWIQDHEHALAMQANVTFS